MRFLSVLGAAGAATLLTLNTATSEPDGSENASKNAAGASGVSAVTDAHTSPKRMPHPVVYIDSLKSKNTGRTSPRETVTNTDTPSQSAPRVPHPVVYDNANVKPAIEARVPHPVVYDDDAAPSGKPEVTKPHVPPVVDYANEPAGDDPETEPAIAPPNPDLDTSEPEIAKPDRSQDAPPVVAKPAPKDPSPAADRIAALIEQKALADLQEEDWSGIAKVYGAQSFEPAWVSKTGLTPQGRILVTTLGNADDWGLDPKHFKTPEIADADEGAETLSLDTWAELELKLTASALRYASHARGGRILNPTEQLSSYLDRKPQLKDASVVLGNLVTADDPSAVLHALHPRHPQFEKLRQQYLALRTAKDTPEAVRIPRGQLLRKGMKHAHVALLRQRLEIAETQPEDGNPFDAELFDETVEAAVRAFQKEYGITSDGLVGNGTRRALNDIQGPDPERLLANMEQWRWMPDELGDTHIWVNIPEYKVRFIRDGEVVYEERIIAGKISQQTPVFSDELETLYFHPKWHVPQSIKVREIYPSLTRGGGYVRQQNLKIAYNGRAINPYSLDWSNRDIRRYHVYQPPGPGNVLGVVKFTFPNKHQVYMHDTPTKHLFKNKQRTYSHGCMRVQNPVQLAELIVDAANGMSQADVDDILRGPRQETPVKLDTKIPVHVTYLTAWVDEDGNEQSAKDIYGHEKKIKLALAGRFDRIAVGPDHLAPVKYVPRPQQSFGATAVQDFLKNLFPGF